MPSLATRPMTHPQSAPSTVGEAFATGPIRRLEENVGRVLRGKPEAIRLAVVSLLAGGHLLIEDVPGVGKTTLAQALAKSLGLSFQRIQFTSDLLPSDIVGVSIFNQKTQAFEFVPGPIFANVVLADEINRATPKTQSALLEAMQDISVTVGKTTFRLEQPFLVLATQNPIEMEGTYPLPEAQLDRFTFKLRVEPPARDELHAILERTTGNDEPAVRPVLGRERLLEMRALVRQVPVAHPVQDYAVRLVEATHPSRSSVAEVKRFVRYGSSPRGAQAVMLAAKIEALRDGRFAPSFADIRRVALPALRHRVLLNFDGEAEGVTSDAVVTAVLGGLPELPR